MYSIIMIACLQGKLVFRGKDFIILDVRGVGYKVFVSEKTLSTLPKTEEQLKLYTYLYLKEETAELYGFFTPQELELFETLNGISGIGPRSALVLSSFGSPERLKEVMEKHADKFFKELKGIGKKKTQKILLELTGKIAEIAPRAAQDKEDDEALDALVSLGVSKQQAKSALSRVPHDVQDTESRIKHALRLLGK